MLRKSLRKWESSFYITNGFSRIFGRMTLISIDIFLVLPYSKIEFMNKSDDE